MKPQLQAGHWYLVHEGEEHLSIRAYMHDGWYPSEPRPLQAICEMSRTQHPDNVELSWDGIEVTDRDRAIIAHYYPLAVDNPLLARGIRGMAEALCQANGKEWDWEKPDADPQERINYLIIAAGVAKSVGGEHPTIRDWAGVTAASGPPWGIFRPKKWPAEVILGAVQLANAS
jgi:hypothetical protein